MSRGFAVRIARQGVSVSAGSQLDHQFREYGWAVRHADRHCSIMASADVDVEVLSEGLGAIVGHAFAKHVPTRALAGGISSERKHLHALEERKVHTLAWGSFVSFAFLGGGTVRFFRSPTSSMQAFLIEYPWGWLVVSHIPKWLRPARGSFSLDRDALAMVLARPSLAPHRSCIVGITPLIGGTYVDLGDRAAEPVAGWEPADFCREELRLHRRDEAVELVRREILRCVAAWADCRGYQQLDLSGGLDSSIIAGVTRKPLTPVNFLYENSEGDERDYAERVARLRGDALVIRSIDPAAVAPQRSAAELFPWPVSKSYVQEPERQAFMQIQNGPANAFVSGSGGDQVFCSLQSTGPIFDAVRDLGWTRALTDTVLDVAAASSSNIWHVYRMFLRRLARRRNVPKLDTTLLNRKAVRLVCNERWHPWLQSSRGLPPGKFEHVTALIRALDDAAGFERALDLPIDFPLLSEPLVEACLRVPTWMWVAGGIDRSVAREAMAQFLPVDVAQRGSKGGFDQFCRAVFRTHHAVIAELIMNGMLRREGLLDERALSHALNAAGDSEPKLFMRLLRLADVEAWIAAWNQRG